MVPVTANLIALKTRLNMATGQLMQVDRRLLERHVAFDGLVVAPGAATRSQLSDRSRYARNDGGRFLTTVLMTDVVDSTGTVARLGDWRWRDLLDDHYADCREEIERAGGELVGTTGDGILAIFDAPSQAVRAGRAIQARAGERGMAVRAGVHTGECVRAADSIAGIAVHIAARICALGAADEVTTTGIVRDLVIGSMLAFAPRGRHTLRGVPGDWTVFGATAAE
jgi:class 3 adenylate cyclase